MPIGQFLGNVGRRLMMPNYAPTDIRTPPFVDSADEQDDDGDQAAPVSSPGAAIGTVGAKPPTPAPPMPTFRPDLDPDTQKYLDTARQGAPMHPQHGTLRTIGETLAGRFLGPDLSTRIFDPAYSKAATAYQHNLQNAQLPAAIRGKAEAQTANTSNTVAEGAVKAKQAANYDANAALGAVEHGGELAPDNPTPAPEGAPPAPPREGSTLTVGGKQVFFPSKRQQRVETEQAKQADWQVITPEMAESLTDLGVKAGDKVPATVFNQYQRIIDKQTKTPKLVFEHFTNQRTGDVTTIGFDPSTGEPKTRHIEKGVAETKVPTADHGVTMLGPDGTVLRLQPGQTAPSGAMTPTQAGSLNTPTQQMRNVAAQAQLVHEQTPHMLSELDRLKDKIGPVAGRWNEVMQGKVGMEDPDFAGLRADLLMYSSAVALMHARGRLPENLRAEFDHAINNPGQSFQNLKAIISRVDDWTAKNASAMGGRGNAAQPTKPIVQKSPSTGQFRYSTDGGKTWLPGQPPQ